jgi:hypothetical protein
MGMRSKLTACSGALVMAMAGLSMSIDGVRADVPPGPSDLIAFVGQTIALNCVAGGAEAPEETPEPATDVEAVEAALDGTPLGDIDNPPTALGGCPAPGIPLVGGWGSYTFATSVCEGVSLPLDGLDGTDDPGPNACSFTSNGDYENIVCGTGEAWSTAAFNTGGADPVAVSDYHINFVGGVGVVTGNSNDGILVGVVVITAPQPTIPPTLPPPGTCVNAFLVVGVAATVETA